MPCVRLGIAGAPLGKNRDRPVLDDLRLLRLRVRLPGLPGISAPGAQKTLDRLRSAMEQPQGEARELESRGAARPNTAIPSSRYPQA